MNIGASTLKPGATTPLDNYLPMIRSRRCVKEIPLLIDDGYFMDHPSLIKKNKRVQKSDQISGVTGCFAGLP